jgi:hypothetical protein
MSDEDRILQIAKRQKIRREDPLIFAQSIILFFGAILKCDSPILEALYLVVYVPRFDFFTRTCPAALSRRIARDTSKHSQHKTEWWENFKRLATPILEEKFPELSKFRDVGNWITCSTCRPHERTNTVHYPIYFWASDIWDWSCVRDWSQMMTRGDKSEAVWLNNRRNARTKLTNLTKLYHNFHLYGDGSQTNSLMSRPAEEYAQSDVYRIDFQAMGLYANYHGFSSPVTYDDFCLILKIPEIIDVGHLEFHWN